MKSDTHGNRFTDLAANKLGGFTFVELNRGGGSSQVEIAALMGVALVRTGIEVKPWRRGIPPTSKENLYDTPTSKYGGRHAATRFCG